MNRQPGYPKGQWIEPPLPADEVNNFVCENTTLTPEQKKYPVMRFGPNGRLEPVPGTAPPATPPRTDS